MARHQLYYYYYYYYCYCVTRFTHRISVQPAHLRKSRVILHISLNICGTIVLFAGVWMTSYDRMLAKYYKYIGIEMSEFMAITRNKVLIFTVTWNTATY